MFFARQAKVNRQGSPAACPSPVLKACAQVVLLLVCIPRGAAQTLRFGLVYDGEGFADVAGGLHRGATVFLYRPVVTD